MTDPAGRSFLSYRRTRSTEAALLIHAQHDIGIPTWQDVRDLAEEPTEEHIRAVLNEDATANAVMWLTRDVGESRMIKQVEAPLIIGRARRGDGFFTIPVAAGGASYDQAAETVKEHIGIDDLKRWNLFKVDEDPLTASTARQIAERVLERRLTAIASIDSPDKPIELTLHTRDVPPATSRTPLALNWHYRFNDREASKEIWVQYLLPALTSVSRLCIKVIPQRRIIAGGLPSIPAATALGHAFLEPRNQRLGWRQNIPGHSEQVWSLEAVPEDSGFETRVVAGDVDAQDLAVLVSVNADVQAAVAASKCYLPKFRAYVHAKRKTSSENSLIESPGQAVHLARLVIACIRAVRSDYGASGCVHLFTAIPVGLAVLMGQLLNTLGAVQTYEHIQTGAVGEYRPAALLFQ